MNPCVNAGRYGPFCLTRTVAWAWMRARISQGWETENFNMVEQLFIGIDVSKTTLDIAVRPTGEKWCTANAPSEISALVERFE